MVMLIPSLLIQVLTGLRMSMIYLPISQWFSFEAPISTLISLKLLLFASHGRAGHSCPFLHNSPFAERHHRPSGRPYYSCNRDCFIVLGSGIELPIGGIRIRTRNSELQNSKFRIQRTTHTRYPHPNAAWQFSNYLLPRW